MFPQHLGDYLKSEFVYVDSVTAGGVGDAAEVNGDGIDRQDFYSGVLQIPVTATLAEGETLTLAVTIQDSADNSTFADTDRSVTSLVLTGGTGGSTETDVLEADLDLKGLKQYVRAQITPTLSAATTDTATYGACLAIGGSVEKPV